MHDISNMVQHSNAVMAYLPSLSESMLFMSS
jgi:hypothetical protein